MFRWLKRKRLSESAQRRLTIALARAEEELIDTHVENVLDVYDAIGAELSLAEAANLYLEEVQPGPQRSEIIARRVMAQMESQPRRRRSSRPEA